MEYRTKQPKNQSPIQRFGRWLSLKQYQIEVTFGVYMFTPTEKFIFWSIAFLLSAMFSIATTLYLPQHILFIISRAWFYAGAGGETTTTTGGTITAKLLHSTTTTTTTTATQIVREL